MPTIREALAGVADATPSIVDQILSKLHDNLGYDGSEDVSESLPEITEEQIQEMGLSIRMELTLKSAQRKARGAPTPGLLTAWEVIVEPCPGIERSDSRTAHKSRTSVPQPRTFGDLKELKDFETDLLRLHTKLDNTQPRYYSPKHAVHGGNFMPVVDEAGVRAVLAVAAPLVNHIAEGLGVKAMLLGAGDNRTFSSTDWMIRTFISVNSGNDAAAGARGSSNSSAVSPTPAIDGAPAVTAGSIRVVGDWQVPLHIGEQLWLAGEQQHDPFLLGMQKIYGDMVLDEVQWGMLTTGNASVIVKRDDDVRNKTLYVSQVFGTDKLLLALLYLLQQAATKKQQLPRDQVKVTPTAGYTRTVELPVVQCTRPATRSQVDLGRAIKRQRQDDAIPAAAAQHSSLGSSARTAGASIGSSRNTICDLQARFPRLIQLTLGRTQLTPTVNRAAASSSGCLTATMVALDFSRVKLLKVLAVGSPGKVFKGEIDGKEVVVKSYDPRFYGSQDAFDAELSAYSQIGDLQGDTVCDVIHFGTYAHTGASFLALSPAGKAVDVIAASKPSVQQGMRSALNKLHQRGFWHGDIQLSNFCVAEDGSVKIINLDEACAHHAAQNAAAQMQGEREQLNLLIREAMETATIATNHRKSERQRRRGGQRGNLCRLP